MCEPLEQAAKAASAVILATSRSACHPGRVPTTVRDHAAMRFAIENRASNRGRVARVVGQVRVSPQETTVSV